MKGTQEISKSYYELFSTLMLYNHKIWRRMAVTLPANHCMVLYAAQQRAQGDDSGIRGASGHIQAADEPDRGKARHQGLCREEKPEQRQALCAAHPDAAGAGFFGREQEDAGRALEPDYSAAAA